MFARKIICKSCFKTECSSFYELKWLPEISQVTWPEAKKKLARDEKENILSHSCILLQRTACPITSLQFQVADLYVWHLSDCSYISWSDSYLTFTFTYKCNANGWGTHFLCVCFLSCKMGSQLNSMSLLWSFNTKLFKCWVATWFVTVVWFLQAVHRTELSGCRGPAAMWVLVSWPEWRGSRPDLFVFSWAGHFLEI